MFFKFLESWPNFVDIMCFHDVEENLIWVNAHDVMFASAPSDFMHETT